MNSWVRTPFARAAMACAALLLAAPLLSSCAAIGAIGPSQSLPSVHESQEALHLDGAVPPLAQDWWTAFQDPVLTRWIDIGLAQSPTMKQAQARLAGAQAAAALARAGELPSLGASASSVGQRVSDNGLFPPPLAGMTHTLNDIDLVGSLQLDLYGGLAARTEAGQLAAEAATADREQARIRLAAAIAHAYFDLARAQRARNIALELEQSRLKTLDLVRKRVEAGFDTQVERRLAEVTVPEIRVDIGRADEQIALARHALAILAGQAPHAADTVDATLPAAQAIMAPPSLPLDLLARRADVGAAQRRARAALREVDAARTDFYPNVSINALVGLDSLTTQKLFEANSRTWQAGPAIHLPLFEGGSLRARLRQDSADADAAIAAYQDTVLHAAGEAADALSSIDAVERQRRQQGEATGHAQVASDLATIRYQAGLGNYLSVLTAQTGVLVQRSAELDLDARAAALQVSLALALGGGYTDPMFASSNASTHN